MGCRVSPVADKRLGGKLNRLYSVADAAHSAYLLGDLRALRVAQAELCNVVQTILQPGSRVTATFAKSAYFASCLVAGPSG